MYRETRVFVWHIIRQKAIWKDGELWTAVLLSIASAFWVYHHNSVVARVRSHFGDLLTVASIIFGFVLSTMVFYVQAAAAWSREEGVQKVADKLLDWHVWTIFSLLSLIGYVIVLWALGPVIGKQPFLLAVEYGLLSFSVLYCGFQILNHTLTLWWVFHKRSRFEVSAKP